MRKWFLNTRIYMALVKFWWFLSKNPCSTTTKRWIFGLKLIVLKKSHKKCLLAIFFLCGHFWLKIIKTLSKSCKYEYQGECCLTCLDDFYIFEYFVFCFVLFCFVFLSQKCKNSKNKKIIKNVRKGFLDTCI